MSATAANGAGSAHQTIAAAGWSAARAAQRTAPETPPKPVNESGSIQCRGEPLQESVGRGTQKDIVDQPRLLSLFCRWCLTEPLSDNFVVRCIACECRKHADRLMLHAGEARVGCSRVRGDK